jgi:hypothetical protein
MTAPTTTPVELYSGPQFNPENVLVGPAALYLRKFDRTKKAPDLIVPNDTPLWSPWEEIDPLWQHIGMTNEGVTNAFSRDTEDITGEEMSIPVLVTTTGAEWNVNTVMIEDVLQVMLWAFGGGRITTVAGTDTEAGYEDLEVAEEMDLMALGLEGKNEFGYARRMVVPKVVSVADVEVEYRRAEDKHQYETSFRSLCRTRDVLIRNITDLPV